MQSREVDLGNVLIESLTLSLGNLDLKGSGLAGAVGTLGLKSATTILPRPREANVP